jgi:hypothetical protein
MQTTHDIDLALQDSIALERASTERELHYVCRTIESRHKVEGISPMALELWETEKTKAIHRVYSVVAA